MALHGATTLDFETSLPILLSLSPGHPPTRTRPERRGCPWLRLLVDE